MRDIIIFFFIVMTIICQGCNKKEGDSTSMINKDDFVIETTVLSRQDINNMNLFKSDNDDTLNPTSEIYILGKVLHKNKNMAWIVLNIQLPEFNVKSSDIEVSLIPPNQFHPVYFMSRLFDARIPSKDIKKIKVDCIIKKVWTK